MDYSHYDCLLVVVVSQGKNGKSITFDTHDAEEVWTRFTPDSCSQLIGKPQLSFVQVCLGFKNLNGQHDKAILGTRQQVTGQKLLYSIPTSPSLAHTSKYEISFETETSTLTYNAKMDLTDANATGQHIPTAVHPKNKGPSRKISNPVDRDSRVYNMQHRCRGKAYIFNHDLFDASLKLSPRVGSKTDVSNLKRALSQLDFEVLCFHNCDITSVRRNIKQLAELDHTDNDCVMVIVLSHGTHGMIYALDSYYHSDELWLPFTSDKCPSLAGKPKLFFIQACQGNKKDAGLTVQSDSSQMDSIAPQEYSIPTMADFMIAYSTIPGYVSWRNTTNGSWFIEALCEILITYGRQEDLLSMMTMVLLKVATLGRDYSQIPCVVSQLIRRVYFPPKQ